MALLEIDHVVDALLDSLFKCVLVDVSENTLQLVVNSFYLVIWHISDIEAKTLLLHISRQQRNVSDTLDVEIEWRWAILKICQA